MGPNMITPDIIKPDITAPGLNILATWSPVSTRSTGDFNIISETYRPTTPFDYGSGHINPVRAVDPRLIYDFDSNDIIDFLCSTGSTPSPIVNLTGEVVSCKYPPTPSYDFNYPSIGVSNMSGSLAVHRTVTYYGKVMTVNHSQVDYPSGVKVTVTLNKLKFSKTGEKMCFRIDMTPYKSSNGSCVRGFDME
ncbi:Subtilisin-like protease SBT5.4 [Camellia lanceoleosa]|uniref:Subtilisin-like protease SBT5.4 n=1 Tax=Camellia lanceoleosa TaxID=1840588 RepID=A0ACC0F347_9ERIC|nr:Subtilisin-like protease SBT5.4 [Camellia lanceoleosa]